MLRRATPAPPAPRMALAVQPRSARPRGWSSQAVRWVPSSLASARPAIDFTAGPMTLLIAGLLVGFGTRLGSGCTSGHGVCGLARLSPRSLVAVLTFMAAGALTVLVLRHLMGGAQ